MKNLEAMQLLKTFCGVKKELNADGCNIDAISDVLQATGIDNHIHFILFRAGAVMQISFLFLLIQK